MCFSDDAIRTGEIDEESARMTDLNALVRKLFGLGRIPLTLTCTIEGISFAPSLHVSPLSACVTCDEC